MKNLEDENKKHERSTHRHINIADREKKEMTKDGQKEREREEERGRDQTFLDHEDFP